MSPTVSVIRVVLAEDEALIRDALLALLGLKSDIEVVAAVADGDEAVAAARNYVSAAMTKLHAATRHEACTIAERKGWI